MSCSVPYFEPIIQVAKFYAGCKYFNVRAGELIKNLQLLDGTLPSYNIRPSTGILAIGWDNKDNNKKGALHLLIAPACTACLALDFIADWSDHNSWTVAVRRRRWQLLSLNAELFFPWYVYKESYKKS